jgi:hypothetical protein
MACWGMACAPAFGGYAVSGPPAQHLVAVASTQAVVTELRIARKELEGARAQQRKNDADYFFNAVEIIVGIAAGLIAIIAVLVAVAGYKAFRLMLREELTTRVTSAFEEIGKPQIEESLREVDKQLGTKLAEFDSASGEALEALRKAAGSSK